ncbi:Uncharacterised protein [Achromobacter spanius]|uniref:hypothetical protein n=1 Tax=Achromobacter spanius TaxID=217203 RepID=UPI000C2BC67A|nr:hypothetical protein [Achromobacter spanius]AUA57487.1 hypothetical protein CVS48_16565 [Achromobacter spanius]CAB3628629.1 hypothetical protein LMG5911_00787 [Achromobacter spanius]SPT37468.1 Uncharacterised protein [Achromobacter denitrificans]VEE54791.1 Uncharacterised protein [Achromobacter spanius]
MKIRNLAALAFVAVLAPALTTAVAQTAPPAPAQSAEQPVDNPQQFDKKAAEVRDNMEKMQQTMNQIQKTTDPNERRKLLQEHQALMQTTMGMMGQFWRGGTMGCCGTMGAGGPHHGGRGQMGWNAMRGNYSNLSPEQIRERQYMRDQYMGMQQMMMEQMMQQQLNRGVPPR